MNKTPSLPVARDTSVSEALKTNADYIFWIDTDHVFESQTDPNLALKQLYSCTNKDPNSKDTESLYRTKQKTGFNYAMWVKPDKYRKRLFTNSIMELEVSTGMLSDVLLKYLKKFQNRSSTGEDMSEDFYFFEKAKKHGWNLHVFTDVRLAHLVNIKVKSDGSFALTEM